ncbi:hypothetical protein DQE59_05025 [Salmonella enterica subsp. enterica serovar Arechavaleta]|nr:hypothetical protein [Salmonella enterica subsp. enterica serovar Arechavaleta]
MECKVSDLVKRGHDQAAELKSSCGAVDVRDVAQLISAKVPAGVQRYLRVNYVVGTGPLTAGAFTSGINLDVDNNSPYYPIRSKVTG